MENIMTTPFNFNKNKPAAFTKRTDENTRPKSKLWANLVVQTAEDKYSRIGATGIPFDDALKLWSGTSDAARIMNGELSALEAAFKALWDHESQKSLEIHIAGNLYLQLLVVDDSISKVIEVEDSETSSLLLSLLK